MPKEKRREMFSENAIESILEKFDVSIEVDFIELLIRNYSEASNDLVLASKVGDGYDCLAWIARCRGRSHFSYCFTMPKYTNNCGW